MIGSARKFGLKYIAITDHSKYLRIAKGLNEKRLLQQIEKIRQLSLEITDFNILAGVEVDVLEDGKLDLGDNVLCLKKFGILANSWGTFLAIEIVNTLTNFEISECILLNPFPLYWNRVLDLHKRFNLRVHELLSEEDKQENAKLESIGTRDIGKKLMEILSPLYVKNPQFVPQLHFQFYDHKIESEVLSSIKYFDQRSYLNKLPKRTLTILCDQDFILKNDIEELATHSFVKMLDNVGNSPFIESPELFFSTINDWFMNSSKMSPICVNKDHHYTWGNQCDGWWIKKHGSFTVIEEQMPCGASEQIHYHSQTEQFFYCLDGSLKIEILEATYALSPKNGIEVPPKIPHRVYRPVRFLVVSCPNSHDDRVNL